MIRKLLIKLGLIKPFTHNPSDFKLKLSPWWAASKYCQIEYSANGGRNWKTIREARQPLFDISIATDYNWTFESIKEDVTRYSLSLAYKRFPTYQSILDFENEQYDRYKKRYAEHKQKINYYYKKIRDAYKNQN